MAARLKTIRDRYTDEEITSFYEQGFWTTDSLYDLVKQRAVERPDAEFLFDSTSSMTYGELAEKSLRLAVGLRRAGLGRGDRIAVQLPNWTEVAPIAAAVSRIGAILVPILPIYRDEEVSYIINHSGASMAITCGDFRGFDHSTMFADICSKLSQVSRLFIVRAPDDLDSSVGDRIERLYVDGDLDELEAEAGEGPSPDEGFLIIYTSGTTSRPKGCFHTFNAVRGSTMLIANAYACGPDDVVIGPSPITHSTGMTISLTLPLVVGARSLLLEFWDPLDALQKIEQYGCSFTVTSSTFLQMLIEAYDPEKHDASSLRVWGCAGAPIPAAVVEKARELFGCKVLSMYGRSENFLTVMCTIDDPDERSVTSDGSALAGSVVKIVDEAGNEVPRGESGDIANKGPWHMIEYFCDDEATNALFTPDGFSRSGDLGVMDADGYVRVTGRLKDIVIRGGMNISAREIEDYLLRHPAVGQVAVVGMPDDRLGEKVCVYVVPTEPGATVLLEDLTSFLRQHKVAVQKLPERLELVRQLPMTATGKIQKHLLRADIAEKLSSGVS